MFAKLQSELVVESPAGAMELPPGAWGWRIGQSGYTRAWSTKVKLI